MNYDTFSPNFDRVIKDFWNYYIELEKDVINIRKYVEFHERNYGTFSLEMLKLYQAICSEIDVIGKNMAKYFDNTFKPEDRKNNILKWWYIVQDKCLITESLKSFILEPETKQKLTLFSIYNKMFNNDISPWSGFNVVEYRTKNGKISYKTLNNSTPKWWIDYNKVKHNRVNGIKKEFNYENANLKNLIYAITALYILERAYLENVGELDDLEKFVDCSLFYTSPLRPMTSKEAKEYADTLFGD